MSELTNLTDRISHLRDRKEGSRILSYQTPPEKPNKRTKRPNKKPKQSTERRVATDYFMLFVYALLGISILIQIGLIVSLDI